MVQLPEKSYGLSVKLVRSRITRFRAALLSQAISFPGWRALARRRGGMTALGLAALGLATVP